MQLKQTLIAEEALLSPLLLYTEITAALQNTQVTPKHTWWVILEQFLLMLMAQRETTFPSPLSK